MKRHLLYIVGFITAFAGIILLGRAQPETLNEWLVMIDRFGFTEEARIEHQRVNQIMALPIAYEKKQVLVDKAVFIGATQKMVILALGNPQNKSAGVTTPNDTAVELWQYHFTGDSRATILKFVSGTLVNAQKVSLADIP